MGASVDLVGELKLKSWMACDTGIMFGDVVFEFQGRRSAAIKFRGRDVDSGGPNFLIDVWMPPHDLKLCSLSGTMLEADWARVPPEICTLLHVLERPLSDAERMFHDTALEAAVVEEVIPPEMTAKVSAKFMARTWPMKITDELGGFLDQVLFGTHN